MPMINRMTDLVNKIERRLGTKMLNLSEDTGKDIWAKEIIPKESLVTFSRFFPNKVRYILGPHNQKGSRTYLIDETICNSFEILGAGDIDWHDFSAKAPAYQFGGGYGSFNIMNESYDVEDMAMTQMVADHVSLFSNGIYLEYIPPNIVQLSTAISVDTLGFMHQIPINLFVKHANNLMTIEPTKMEDFERLCMADVARFLYETYKYYDGVETNLATTDLKLDRIQEVANSRDELIEYFKNSYVNPANRNQPIMYCIN